jgi:uncharacterized protein (DUF1800 family)
VIASLNTAIDNLFNHPNTGPFVCTQLIHQLVSSNASPAYVGRCSAALANNGSGVRGDLKAVITSILLDPEVRGDVKTDPNYGHLREPVLLMTHILRAFNATDNIKTDGVMRRAQAALPISAATSGNWYSIRRLCSVTFRRTSTCRAQVYLVPSSAFSTRPRPTRAPIL